MIRFKHEHKGITYELEGELEDVGIGAYEHGSVKGFDSNIVFTLMEVWKDGNPVSEEVFDAIRSTPDLWVEALRAGREQKAEAWFDSEDY